MVMPNPEPLPMLSLPGTIDVANTNISGRPRWRRVHIAFGDWHLHVSIEPVENGLSPAQMVETEGGAFRGRVSKTIEPIFEAMPPIERETFAGFYHRGYANDRRFAPKPTFSFGLTVWGWHRITALSAHECMTVSAAWMAARNQQAQLRQMAEEAYTADRNRTAR